MRTLIALLACLAAVWAADTRPVTSHQRPAEKVSARPDAQIEADIRARLAKSKINADKFTVRVQGGVATLEGRTDVIQHKGVATRLAKAGGAASVNNRIQISEAARAKAAGNLEKGRRRAQLKRSEARSAK
jgi:osmotically-inducible protein OsmY